jgi:hypothetical protein
MLFRLMSEAAPSVVPRAICITRDAALRRTLRRTLNAAGSSVEFRDDLDPNGDTASILFIDRDSRRASLLPELRQIIGEDGKIIFLGDSIEDDEVVALLRHHLHDHVISDAADGPDDAELVVTSVKLLSGDIFGLEKYLSWGVKVHELEISDYEQKREALMSVAHQAKELGARRQVIAKIESVTDELLMNALYDAPAIRNGVSPSTRIAKTTEAGGHPGDEAALLRWACDGRYFAVSVQDNYGELHKEAIIDHLLRARAERGRPKSTDDLSGGAGLGLYFILSSVTRFIANIDPGRRTEVVCLFDLKVSGRDTDSCARSLHIFTAPEEPDEDERTTPGWKFGT